jgi:hypothetical protein
LGLKIPKIWSGYEKMNAFLAKFALSSEKNCILKKNLKNLRKFLELIQIC